jgi:hypothetical protein
MSLYSHNNSLIVFNEYLSLFRLPVTMYYPLVFSGRIVTYLPRQRVSVPITQLTKLCCTIFWGITLKVVYRLFNNGIIPAVVFVLYRVALRCPFLRSFRTCWAACVASQYVATSLSQCKFVLFSQELCSCP